MATLDNRPDEPTRNVERAMPKISKLSTAPGTSHSPPQLRARSPPPTSLGMIRKDDRGIPISSAGPSGLKSNESLHQTAGIRIDDRDIPIPAAGTPRLKSNESFYQTGEIRTESDRGIPIPAAGPSGGLKSNESLHQTPEIRVTDDRGIAIEEVWPSGLNSNESLHQTPGICRVTDDCGIPIPAAGPSGSKSNECFYQITGIRTDHDRGIPIPSGAGPLGVTSNESLYQIEGYESYRTTFTAPSSWQTSFQTPFQTPSSSSWGLRTPLLNLDDATSLYGADDQSDRLTDAGSVAGLSYARKRRLLRHMTRSSLDSTITGPGLHLAEERWTKKLEDFRKYEVGMLKSLLPFKAGFGAALVACLSFAKFIPPDLTYYGTVAVLGVGMSLESNVGLTLQKGTNLMLGSALAGVCASVVSLIEPYTGNFQVFYLIICVFLGGCLPRCISLPAIIKTRWAQSTTYYISVFHGLILNQTIKIENPAQFLLNCLYYTMGFVTVLFLTLCVKPDYAGDNLLVLLVSDFHTAGVVLERIVEDYKGGVVLTKIPDLLAGIVTEDHIHHDLQYIQKSTNEVEKLMNAVRWEPSHGKFFKGYPWDLYPTLLRILLHVMYDLIALDSALRAEIQAPVEIRLLFAKDMEIVAKECSMLFHKLGDALQEHKKVDYQTHVQRAQLATLSLRTKLNRHSAAVIARDLPLPPSRHLTRNPSAQSIQEGYITRDPSRHSIQEDYMNRNTSVQSIPDPDHMIRNPSVQSIQEIQEIQEIYEDLPEFMSPMPTPPPSPSPKTADKGKGIQQDLETAPHLNIAEDDWRAQHFTMSRRQSISDHWEETQLQISSLSFIKFASVLIELMGKVNGLVTMLDQISEKARFSDVS